MDIIYTFDIGGTFIKIAKFNKECKNYLNKWSVSTKFSKDENVIIDVIKEYANKLDDGEKLYAISVSVPGPVKDGVVLGAQNIGWETVYLKEILSKSFENVKVFICNDANSATLGEYYFGNYKEKSLVLLTLGTGIGGGIIIDGQIVEGANGSCGECGHINVKLNGRKCTCGLSGCLEQYCSATGVVLNAKKHLKKQNSILNSIENFTSKDVFDNANTDEVCAKAVEDTCKYLGLGIASICNTLNPGIVLIGGGVSSAGNALLDKTIYYFNKYAFYSIKNTRIEIAKLKGDAGVYGLYALAIR